MHLIKLPARNRCKIDKFQQGFDSSPHGNLINSGAMVDQQLGDFWMTFNKEEPAQSGAIKLPGRKNSLVSNSTFPVHSRNVFLLSIRNHLSVKSRRWGVRGHVSVTLQSSVMRQIFSKGKHQCHLEFGFRNCICSVSPAVISCLASSWMGPLVMPLVKKYFFGHKW